MPATFKTKAIAILMLSSSIFCASHADAFKSEKTYFSKENLDKLKNWISSNKPISKKRIETEAFKNLSNNYLKILNKSLGSLFK